MYLLGRHRHTYTIWHCMIICQVTMHHALIPVKALLLSANTMQTIASQNARKTFCFAPNITSMCLCDVWCKTGLVDNYSVDSRLFLPIIPHVQVFKMMPTYCSCCRISSKRGGAGTQLAAFTQSTEKTVAISVKFDCGNLRTEALGQRKISRHKKKAICNGLYPKFRKIKLKW